MTPNYKVAVIQLHPKPLNPDFNFQKATRFILSAAQQGANLAVLPEYHLTNWIPDDPKFREICTQWSSYLEKYKALAKQCKICIVPGTIVEAVSDEETGEDKLVNVCYFINPTGEVIGRYEKKNLWHLERPHLTSSATDPHTVFQTPIGPVGLLICWDLAFPEAFRELISAGAKTIIIPTFWTLTDCSPYGLSVNPHAEVLFLEATTVARAYENTCCIVFVNAGGPAKKGVKKPDPDEGQSGKLPDVKPSTGHYAGMSRVVLPFVGALGDETKGSAEEGMSIVDVNMRHVEEAEKNYKVREDMGLEDWHYKHKYRWGEEKL